MSSWREKPWDTGYKDMTYTPFPGEITRMARILEFGGEVYITDMDTGGTFDAVTVVPAVAGQQMPGYGLTLKRDKHFPYGYSVPPDKFD